MKLTVKDSAAYALNGSAGSKPLEIDHALLREFAFEIVRTTGRNYDSSTLAVCLGVLGLMLRDGDPGQHHRHPSKLCIFECWQGEGELAVFAADHPQHDFLTCDVYGRRMTHIYSIRAATWEEAMTAHHAAQGWEPYKPMED